MRIRTRAALLGIVFGVLCTTLSGCDFFLGSTKMGSGQLYQSGDGRYDAYFSSVHEEQVASASWPDDSKASREPIITALNLRPGSSNSTILSATREKKGDSSLGPAIDQTVAAERERARKLTAVAAKLDDMQKRGEELKKQTIEDKQNLGADKADEKKVAQKDEVKREMSAAVDAVESMASDARKGAKEAQELASKLRPTWTGKDEDEGPPPKRDDEKRDTKKDDKKATEPIAKKAPAKPAAAKKPRPESSSEDKPKQPAQKPPDEVFNP